MKNYKKAYLAGGCFWGMEELFRTQPGVIDTEVGYQGGQNDNPTYRNHPGHAEGIEITYDPVVPFWKAEPEHQDYLLRKPNGYTCHFLRFDEPFI